jgi:hypothetical protein
MTPRRLARRFHLQTGEAAMSEFDSLGIKRSWGIAVNSDAHYRFEVTRTALHRIMEFTGHSIDDIINNPIAGNEVLGYYKVYRYVERRCEAINAASRRNSGRVKL